MQIICTSFQTDNHASITSPNFYTPDDLPDAKSNSVKAPKANFLYQSNMNHNHNHLLTFYWDHPGEPVPEENFWTLWWKINRGRHTHHPADMHTAQNQSLIW